MVDSKRRLAEFAGVKKRLTDMEGGIRSNIEFIQEVKFQWAREGK